MKRVVVKIGTQVLIDEKQNLATRRLTGIINDLARLRKKGVEVIIITSGAVGLGRSALRLKKSSNLVHKQSCAAVGQSVLMNTYSKLFQRHKIHVAQILLTAEDLTRRVTYLSIRNTLEDLIKMKVIPIINENDPLSTSEIEEDPRTKVFGDNDKLSALVASKVDADGLIILTNVDGIYDSNPKSNPDARRISIVKKMSDLSQVGISGQSELGRGGMKTKIEAAQICSQCGITVAISNGMTAGVVGKTYSFLKKPTQNVPGTIVYPEKDLPTKKRWIGFSSAVRGTYIVNDRAMQALRYQGASLLFVGIEDVVGDFEVNEVVSIQTQDGVEVGRGMTEYSSDEARKITGKRSDEVKKIFGNERPTEAIHRDQLVILQGDD